MMNYLRKNYTQVTFPDHNGNILVGRVSGYRDRGDYNRDTVIVTIDKGDHTVFAHVAPYDVTLIVPPVNIDEPVAI